LLLPPCPCFCSCLSFCHSERTGVPSELVRWGGRSEEPAAFALAFLSVIPEGPLPPQIIHFKDFPPKISEINILPPHPTRNPNKTKIERENQGD
jgi:hypothetical protein